MLKVKEINVKSYITSSKLPGIDFVINPYVGCSHKCAYCYAEFMKRFTNHTEPWGEFLDVKRCDFRFSAEKYAGKKILLSSVTDAYNPFEKKYEITRRILEALLPLGAKIRILTKSDLVLRDMDLFQQFSSLQITFSMNSLDDSFRKIFEPYASPVAQRLQALRTLYDKGFATAIFMSPIFPAISDFEALIHETRSFVDEFWFENLKLRNLYRQRILDLITRHYPEHLPLYEKIYLEKNGAYWKTLEWKIEDFCLENGLRHEIYFSET
ncbi:MAG: radical SAM protein [Planctomycetia bacterium]|nr:radical SAM protein [Planctomycetia bacterium]